MPSYLSFFTDLEKQHRKRRSNSNNSDSRKRSSRSSSNSDSENRRPTKQVPKKSTNNKKIRQKKHKHSHDGGQSTRKQPEDNPNYPEDNPHHHNALIPNAREGNVQSANAREGNVPSASVGGRIAADGVLVPPPLNNNLEKKAYAGSQARRNDPWFVHVMDAIKHKAWKSIQFIPDEAVATRFAHKLIACMNVRGYIGEEGKDQRQRWVELHRCFCVLPQRPPQHCQQPHQRGVRQAICQQQPAIAPP
jgi:hypothetical protein